MTMPRAIDFLGIGGIGMSALARWALAQGISVSGYDKTPSPLTDALRAEGARVRFDDRPEAAPADTTTWVIYTPAIPAQHPQLKQAVERGQTVMKRAAFLGMLANDGTCLAVAGTHGKTTTSCLLTWILHQSGRPVQAFLGGISSNLQSNFLPGPAEITVVEADEFDRSFLHLHPTAAVITSTDADHLDIYGDAGHVAEAFGLFARQCDQVYRSASTSGVSGVEYGLGDQAYRAENVRVENGKQHFTLVLGEDRVDHVQAGLPGMHNIENAVAAACLAHHVGLSAKEIAQGISSFTGVRRRFDVRWTAPGQAYIDDYAHHPTEIARLLDAVHSLYPGLPVALLFQPHLFSRTRDFMPGFAEALGQADRVGILPIYPAREVAIPGITSEALVARIPGAEWVPASEGVQWLAAQPEAIKLTVGAGDIDRLVEPFVERLQHSAV